MFQRLLICTNLSDGLQRLVSFVPSLAAANLRHITFLHCVPINEAGAIPRIDTDKVQQAQAILGTARQNVPADITVDVRVESGRPSDLIAKVAKEQKADLIMVGYSVRSVLSEKLFGSTTVELYSKTLIPILLLRPQLISTYTTEELDLRCRHLFRYLMLPYDGTEAAKYLVAKVKQLMLEQTQPVTEKCHIVWVVDDCDRRDIPREPYLQEAKGALITVQSELSTPSRQVTTEVRIGNPVVEIIEAALEPDVSAIAVCHNPRHSLLEFSVPSFTQDLLRQSWHPILFIPFTR